MIPEVIGSENISSARENISSARENISSASENISSACTAEMDIFPTREIVFGAAPIDWCEANYDGEHAELLGFRVAEYHNTYTNGAYCLAAILLGREWFKKRARGTMRKGHGIFLFYVLCLLMTGVTSGLFHATLVWGWQKADEIFENLTVLSLFHATFIDAAHEKSENRVHLRMLSHSALAALGIWCIPEVFCEVHLIIMAFASVYRFTCHTGGKLHTLTVLKTATYALVGFVGWICDFAFCATFSKYYLHAYCWHTLTGLALYEAGNLLMCLFDTKDGKEL